MIEYIEGQYFNIYVENGQTEVGKISWYSRQYADQGKLSSKVRNSVVRIKQMKARPE